MLNASTTTAVPTDGNSGGSQDITQNKPTGVDILLVIIYGAMVGIMCVLFVQRLLLRIAPKYSKGYTDVTKHAPKNLREDIQKRLMHTMNIYYDPILLSNDDHRHQSLQTPEAPEQYNYLYRMKVIDHMKKLEDSLCKHEETLKRPHHMDLAQHLRDMKSRNTSSLKNVLEAQITALAVSYEHARYKQEAFGVENYNRFFDIFTEVTTAVNHKSKKKRSGKKAASRKNQNSSNDASSKHLDTEPLIQGPSTSQA